MFAICLDKPIASIMLTLFILYLLPKINHSQHQRMDMLPHKV